MVRHMQYRIMFSIFQMDDRVQDQSVERLTAVWEVAGSIPEAEPILSILK